MKSSTIRRSTLSKESMDVIENLAGDAPIEDENIYEAETDNLPDEYLRPEAQKHQDSKSKEIDMLWQSFKTAQFNPGSPIVSIFTGFILGVIFTVLLISLVGVAISNNYNEASKPITIGSLVLTKKSNSIQLEENVNNAQTVANQKVSSLEEEPTTAEEKVEEPVQNEVSLTNKVMKKYTIKDGDTVEGIIKHYYGAYSPERAQDVMKANNLSNLDHINIGQVLLIPMDK